MNANTSTTTGMKPASVWDRARVRLGFKNSQPASSVAPKPTAEQWLALSPKEIKKLNARMVSEKANQDRVDLKRAYWGSAPAAKLSLWRHFRPALESFPDEVI